MSNVGRCNVVSHLTPIFVVNGIISPAPFSLPQQQHSAATQAINTLSTPQKPLHCIRPNCSLHARKRLPPNMSRLPLRLAAVTVFFFSFLLFLSGWIVQQRSLSAMQAILNPHPAAPTAPPSKLAKPGLHLWGQTEKKRKNPKVPDGGAGDRGKSVAYVQYVAEKDKLCNSIMILAELDRMGTAADKVLLYPHSWVADDGGTWSRLLRVAEQRYGVIVKAVDPLVEAENTPSVSLLHVFAETKYSRVLHLDSSGMVLRHFDELLFNAPSVPVAAIRAYWQSQKQQAEAPLSSHLLLIEPSYLELERVKGLLRKNPKIPPGDLVNELYASHALILPQHPYGTLISEFRTDNHERYVLGGKDSWDPVTIRDESYYVNFEDEQAPKPWHIFPREIEERVRPKMSNDQKVWKALYNRWARQRMDVCGLDLEPLPAGF